MVKLKTILTVKSESTWSGFGILKVRIKQSPDGVFFIETIKKIGTNEDKLGEVGTTIKTRRHLATRDMDGILERLRSIEIHASPDFKMGCDGEFTELEIGGYTGKAHYRWWSVPPDDWEPLENFAQEILNRADICTDFIPNYPG